MRRHKRVAMVTGFVGALIALALSFAAPTPALASNENVVTVTKVTNGTPAQPGNFEITVSCAGQSDQTVTIAPTGGTGSATFPKEAVDCSVRESQDRGADSSTIQATSSDTDSVITNPSPTDATVGVQIEWTGPVTGDRTASVFIVNNFNGSNPNTVNVTKAFTGTVPAGAFAQVVVNCKAGSPPASDRSALFAADGTQSLQIPATDTDPCVVSEPVVSPGNTQSRTMNVPVPGTPLGPIGSFLPGGGAANTPKSVTVTNRYLDTSPNHIVVTKRVRGEVPPGVSQFVVNVTCTNAAGDPVNTPTTDVQSFAFPITGGVHTFDVSKDYRDCEVEEVPNIGAPAAIPGTNYQATILPTDGVLNNAGPTDVKLTFAAGVNHTANVIVTNRYPDPTPNNVIRVTKVIEGEAPEGELFLVRVTCSNTGATVYPLLFGSGQSTTQEIQVPQDAVGGNTCTLVESSIGSAVAVVYAGAADTPNTSVTVTQDPGGSVVVTWPLAAFADPNGDEIAVTVTNRYNASPLPDNTLVIKKRIRGNAPDSPSFTIRVRCTGSGVTDEQVLAFDSQVPQTLAIPANRNSCVVQELTNGGATTVEYFATTRDAPDVDATYGAFSGRIEFGAAAGDQFAKVRITNRFPGNCPPRTPYC